MQCCCSYALTLNMKISFHRCFKINQPLLKAAICTENWFSNGNCAPCGIRGKQWMPCRVFPPPRTPTRTGISTWPYLITICHHVALFRPVVLKDRVREFATLRGLQKTASVRVTPANVKWAIKVKKGVKYRACFSFLFISNAESTVLKLRTCSSTFYSDQVANLKLCEFCELWCPSGCNQHLDIVPWNLSHA